LIHWLIDSLIHCPNGIAQYEWINDSIAIPAYFSG